jgi:hypothetical protein
MNFFQDFNLITASAADLFPPLLNRPPFSILIGLHIEFYTAAMIQIGPNNFPVHSKPNQ